MPDPFSTVRNIMSFQQQIDAWKKEDYVRRMRNEKRTWLQKAYTSATKGSIQMQPQITERIERDLIQWESAFRRGKDAAIGPYAISEKARGPGLGKGRELSTEEERGLRAQGLDAPFGTTKGELPSLVRALVSKRQAVAGQLAQTEQRQWEEYKINKTDELSTRRLFLSDALRQQASNVDWQRGEDKRALDNQSQLMKMEKAQLELMDLQKPVHERADNMYKLMMKQVDLKADILLEQEKQDGRVELAEIRGEEQRLTKMKVPIKEDSITKFKRVLPQMQTVGDILRYYIGEKHKTEDAWRLTKLSAESLGVKTDTTEDSSNEDKLKFYRMSLPVPQALDTRTRSFSKYNSYDQVIQDLREWGLDPATDLDAADIIQQAQQYFQNVRGSAESMLSQGLGGGY